MAITKYASLEHAQVLELRSAPSRMRHASLGKLADFNQYRTEDGYLYARIRAISSRVNKNHDGWPAIELAGGQDVFDRHTSSADGFTVVADSAQGYGFSTFLGKPIFIDHHNSDPTRARGAIVDSRLHVEDHKTASLDPYYSSDDVDPEHLPGTWVELLLEVDAKAFPKFAKAIVEGSRNPRKGIDGWSMGCDVEKSVCSICKNAASAPDDYCQHVRMKGAIFDYTDPHTGRKTSKRAYENCYGVKFFEISGVFDPADETALSLEHARTSKVGAGYQLPASPEEWHQFEPDEQVPDDVFQLTPCPQCHTNGLNAGGHCRNCGYTIGGEEGDGLGYQEADRSGPGTLLHDQWDPQTHPTRWGKSQEETITQDPKEEGLKDVADDQAEDYLDESGRKRRKKQANVELDQIATLREGLPQNIQHQVDDLLIHQGVGATMRLLEQVRAEQAANRPNLFQRLFSKVRRTAENPLPQSELSHAPEHVDTLREEEVCPVCGSSMDEDTCDVCGYQEPPDGFDNPDLTKAQDGPLAEHQDAAPETSPEPTDLSPAPPGDQGAVNTPNNPTALAHVTKDMNWDVHSRTSARINKVEQPLVSSTKPQTNEPKEKIIKDQLQPVTSHVRTAEDFIAAAGATKRNTQMNHTADAASGAPAVAKPDVNTDVTGVGGVDQASNDAASKADAQVEVTAIGGTGVESVSAEQEGVNVDQGDEHSKNIEAIHTDTWSTQERQHAPVTREPFPASEDGVHALSHWIVEGHDDEVFPDGGDGLSGGGAVKGVKPVAEQFGDRVDVLQHTTSPSNNSGPTKTWSGTDGNGVTKQQDPVTTESIALGESGMEGKPNWTSSTHIFAAFKLADLEVDLGLIPADKKYERAAELERETPTVIEASLKYAQRIKTAALRKQAGVQKLPVMGRPTTVAKEASTESASTDDDSFMFGGL